MLLLKMGPEVSSRARRALPALRRGKKEDGHRPSEFLVNQMLTERYISTGYQPHIAIAQSSEMLHKSVRHHKMVNDEGIF